MVKVSKSSVTALFDKLEFVEVNEMEAVFGKSTCINSWMQLVRKVRWNFPGLETEERIEEH